MNWSLDLFNPAPSRPEVEVHLRRILESPEFARAIRLKELLAFVVGRVLEGRIDQLTAPAIAAGVFQRGGSFDPETDSIVRTEAARLRSRLEDYYAQSGRRERVRIMLNRRDYVPVFVIRRPGRFRAALDFLRARPALTGAVIALLAAIALLLLALHG